jgi:predicted aminopeptidase
MKSILTCFYSNLPVFIAAVLLVGFSIVCSGCYTLKQGTTMLGYLNRAVPLEDIAAADESSEEDRLFVQRVTDIRRFAMEELGLEESKNYTRYVELDRDYLAAVVSASAKDSFTPHEWWFPVVGKVPYKGFFNVEDARKERAKLEKKDLDVWVRGVDAFSTLGWFRDPLYSYMKKYSERNLAELIIHELLHATVYLKNHSQFNEELAEFAGSEGARLFMEKTGNTAAGTTDDSDDSVDSANAEADNLVFRDFIRGLANELDAVYKSGISREEKLARKEKIIEAAKAKFEENYDAVFKTGNYRGFSELPVNNAYLELYRLYYGEDRYFKELYEKSGRNLPEFIAAAKRVKGRGDPKVELESALGLKQTEVSGRP